MSTKLKFRWIDDNPERKTEAHNMEESLNVKISFGDVKTHDLHNYLEEMLSGNAPDLIIIDHKFEDADSGVFKTGSTISAYIREYWPSCPIVCVTGVDSVSVDFQKKSLYESVYEYHNISNHYSEILSIAKSFKKMENTSIDSISDVMKLLNVPEEDEEKLANVMPKELKNGLKDKGINTLISHWVRSILITRPGFLYDIKWLSMTLGIKENSFHKVEKLFNKALYKGLFANESDPRWWRSEILTILNEKSKDGRLSQEKGRKLKGINNSDYSQCYVNSSDTPQTIAYVDETPNSTQRPMHLKNTIHHPSFQSMLHFEEIRLMKPFE